MVVENSIYVTGNVTFFHLGLCSIGISVTALCGCMYKYCMCVSPWPFVLWYEIHMTINEKKKRLNCAHIKALYESKQIQMCKAGTVIRVMIINDNIMWWRKPQYILFPPQIHVTGMMIIVNRHRTWQPLNRPLQQHLFEKKIWQCLRFSAIKIWKNITETGGRSDFQNWQYKTLCGLTNAHNTFLLTFYSR